MGLYDGETPLGAYTRAFQRMYEAGARGSGYEAAAESAGTFGVEPNRLKWIYEAGENRAKQSRRAEPETKPKRKALREERETGRNGIAEKEDGQERKHEQTEKEKRTDWKGRTDGLERTHGRIGKDARTDRKGSTDGQERKHRRIGKEARTDKKGSTYGSERKRGRAGTEAQRGIARPFRRPQRRLPQALKKSFGIFASSL